MLENFVFHKLSVQLSEFGAIDSSTFNSWKNAITEQERRLSQTLSVTEHGNTNPHTNNGGYHGNNHYNNTTPHSNSAGYHTNNWQTNYNPHIDNLGYHTNNRSYTYYPHSNDSAYHYNNRSYTYTPHYDNSAYHYNNRSYTYTPHIDNAGYHYNNRQYTYTPHSNSGYHSNSGHSNSGSHSNYWYNHTNTTPHTNNYQAHLQSFKAPHQNEAAFHRNTRGTHTDSMSSHKNTPGTHGNNRVNNPTGSHNNNAGSHSNSGGTTYTPHSNYASSHSNTGHGNYVPHSNGGDYHSNSGHGNYIPHSNGGDSHTNSGHGNYTPHSNTGASHNNTGYTQAIPHTNNATSHNNNGLHTNYVPHSNTRPHNNSAFDHQNYIPSKTHFFNVENDTLVKGTVSIGLFAFDKNNDGSGTQDTLSKTVKYTLSIRKVRNLDGSTSYSDWRTLINATTQDMYDLNTIDPMGTGNSNPKATEGYYEIKAVAKNDSKTEGDVTKDYVGQEQVITVKVQQNTDPDISVVNGSEFIGFTFSAQGAMTSTGSYKSYSDKLYANAPVDKQAGLFVTVNMTDPDNGNYQKAEVYLQKPDGITVVNSTVDVIWSNGSSVIQSNGIARTGYAFIPYPTLTSLGDMNGIKVVVDLKDYYDSTCTEEAGGHINRSTLSKSDSTVMLLNTDVTKPTVTDSGNPTAWVKSATLSVSATDNKTGINRIQKPDGNWVSGSSASHVVNSNGNYTFIVEDKAGNQTIKTINVTKVDSGLPSINLTPSTTSPTNQDVIITANVSDDISGVAVQKWASGNQALAYFASAGTVLNGSFAVSSNNTYTVYAKDNAGNETVKTITVSNIDKIDPIPPTLSASTVVPTNQNVTVTIAYPGDAYLKEYKIGSTGVWTTYTTPVVLSDNNTVYARARDIAGNYSSEASLVVGNIDKTPPAHPTLAPSTTLPTNQNVSVTITYPSDANVKQYKIGSTGTWITYTSAVVLSDNNTIYARCQDVAGNWSSEGSLAVGNIDKIAPAIPTLSANTTAWTNQNVSVSITYPSDASIREYKIGTGAWTTYSTLLSIDSNTTVYARARDIAGNYSAEGLLEVTNIDKTVPSIILTPNTTAPTNQNVTVSVSVTDNASGIAVKKWASGSQNASYFATAGTTLSDSFVVSSSGVYTVYAKDTAGNETVQTIKVSNIDKTAPATPTLSANTTAWTNQNVSVAITFPGDAFVKQYKTGSAGTWTTYSSAVVLSGNNTVYARCQDDAGNWSAEGSLTVTNIDKTVPSINLIPSTTAPTNQDVTVSASVADNASGIIVKKWASGNLTVDYFANAGTTLGNNFIASENGIYTVYAKDNAGNETVKTITLENIDKVTPVITIAPYVTTPTNQNITVTATTNEGTLNVTSHVFKENGSFEFVATDSAGNITRKTVTIDNIDKIAPVITIAPYVTTPTNQDIIVTAVTNEGSLNATSHKFTENGRFEFVATDLAGNVTKKTVTIDNIDKIAPDKPTLSASTIAPTNKDVTVTISFPTDAYVKQYKIGNTGTWTDYTTPVVLSDNNTIYARCRDIAGNWSNESNIMVTNIDKLPLVITVNPYNTTPTNQDIIVTASINKPYGMLNKVSHTFTENGSFEFVATDPAGNITRKTVTITNIDKTAPNMPTLKADITKPTNTDVTVTIEYPSDGNIKQYKVGVNDTWKPYTMPVVLSSNETVYARTQDIAGNWSNVAEYKVGNIDKVLPIITIKPFSKAPTNQNITVYASVNKGTLNAVSYTFAQNGSFEFIATDPAGNVTRKTVTIDNIDKIAPNTPVLSADKTIPTNTNVTVSISYPIDAHVKLYKIGENDTWKVYTDSVVLSTNETVYAKCQDIAGNWSFEGRYTVSNIDKDAPDKPTFVANMTAPTNKDVVVTVNFPADGYIKQYRTDTGTWVNYTTPLVFSENGTVYARTQDIAGNWSEVSSYIINNIDKNAPTAPRVQVLNYNILIIDGSIDKESGLEKYMYQLNNGVFMEYTGTVELADGQYRIVAKAVDKAGNETSASLDYLVFKSALDRATEAVVRAENTRTQVNVDIAKPLIDALPNVREKTDLSTRLAHVQGLIDVATMTEELESIQSNIANDLVVRTAQVTSMRINVSNIENRIRLLPTTVSTTSIENLVVEVKLELDATQTVIIAEQSLQQLHVNNARVLVNKVTHSLVKNALDARLDKVQAKINGLEAVNNADTQDKIDNAWDIVAQMPDGELKDRLQDELAKIDMKLKKAIEAVEKAEARPTVRDYIVDADNKVKSLKDSIPLKPGLVSRVQVLKDAFNEAIRQAEYQENLRQANYYTEQAERYITQYYIDKAQSFVNLLPSDDMNRTSLQERIDVVQQRYDDTFKPPVDQGQSKEVKEATKWVEYAEKYRTAVYMNKAQKLVTELPNSPDKEALQSRLELVILK